MMRLLRNRVTTLARFTPAIFICLAVLVLGRFHCAACAGEGNYVSALTVEEMASPSYRVPVDVVWWNGHAWTANSRSGTLSCVDTARRQVVSEWKVAPSLSGLAVYREGLLLLDDAAHQLLFVQPDETGVLKLRDSIRVPQFPVDVVVGESSNVVAVSSVWSKRVTLLKPQHNGLLQIQSTIDLEFAPGRLMLLPGHLLVVADSFGGRLLGIDTRTGTVVGEHAVFGHNIRGLAVNPTKGSLMVTCQTLDPSAFTSYERIFWGVVMQNGLHSLPLASLFGNSTSGADSVTERSPYSGNMSSSGNASSSPQSYPLGTPSIGSGDPGDLVVTGNDTTLLLISGVDQLAFRTASYLPFERLKTGRRPESICLDDRQSHAVVANRFDDSLTVVSLLGESPTVESTVSLGAQRSLCDAELGEQYFYDARLSLDGWYSCHSCHTDGHTNGLKADTFGDEDRGAPKKVMSLRGVAHAGPWAWNGSKSVLEEQIRTSLIISMQTQLEPDEMPVRLLSAFLESLPTAPSISEARGLVVDASELKQGWATFDSVGCSGCHSGDALTSDGRFDVGLHDEMGETAFNPPSLRGVSQRAPYFHDGRAFSLEEVLKSSHHDSSNPLNDLQIQNLKQLLETL